MLQKEKPDSIYVYGKHAVEEAILHARHTIQKIFFIYTDDRIYDLAKNYNIEIERLNPQSLPRWVDTEAVHQGVIALISEKKLVLSYKEFIEDFKVENNKSIVILGEIQDPQNVGAIIRVSVGMGVSAVFIPEHNQAQLTSAVIKVSAGMAFRVPLVKIGNVNHTTRELKEKGFWIYGLEMNTKNPLSKEVFDAPAVFILGNEGKGLREKTRDVCDIMLSIPIDKKCESLNVASSASIVLYEWNKQVLQK